MKQVFIISIVVVILIGIMVPSSFAETSNSQNNILQNSEKLSHDDILTTIEDYCKNLEPINYQVGFDLSTIGEIDTKTGSYEMIFWQTFVAQRYLYMATA